MYYLPMTNYYFDNIIITAIFDFVFKKYIPKITLNGGAYVETILERRFG